MLRKLLLPLLFVALLFSIAAQDDRSYSADRFDVDLSLIHISEPTRPY